MTMQFTRYLVVQTLSPNVFSVRLTSDSPITTAQEAASKQADLRYSPILPVLRPKQSPLPPPTELNAIVFFFARNPYCALGKLKTQLAAEELPCLHFTEGLASLVLVNTTMDRACELRSLLNDCPIEFWNIVDGQLKEDSVTILSGKKADSPATHLTLPTATEPELLVYLEQVSACLTTLWAAYSIYFPEECESLIEYSKFVNELVTKYRSIRTNDAKGLAGLVAQKQANAIISALVEVTAALTYAVAQGTTGASPILASRSPFPHHSLLGVGSSIRALTIFTRYLESAFMSRSATDVIASQYATLEHPLPTKVERYSSGPQYQIDKSKNEKDPAEIFDRGGHFKQNNHVPLIAHFSLRHGFMESKFSVTAASESLTVEIAPPWTLMTLSHEIMHSRVRAIFDALFGIRWGDNESAVIRKEHFQEFKAYLASNENEHKAPIGTQLRNAIFQICCLVEEYEGYRQNGGTAIGEAISYDKLVECYSKHKQLAIEIMVHFHDYYFAYACQPKMYLMSLWASWIKVAAPYARPDEYLVRSLATVACGTGLDAGAAFSYASEKMLEALDALEGSGITSPLFDSIRTNLKSAQADANNTPLVQYMRLYFKPLYYLADQIRLFFASPKIVELIDRIDDDPFSEGTADASEYTATIYVYGEEGSKISPIRYSLAALFRALSRRNEIGDLQWLTAWNYMVISSQEKRKC